jgi:hypothetical protein
LALNVVVVVDSGERVEVDSASALFGAADADVPDGKLCRRPPATPAPGGSEGVGLRSPVGDIEAVRPVGLASGFGEKRPPELLTAISPGEFSGLRLRRGASLVRVDEPDDDVSVATEPDAGDELDDDCESDGELVPESAGSASATPGVLATATPIPSASANAPTRPTYLELPIAVPPSGSWRNDGHYVR